MGYRPFIYALFDPAMPSHMRYVGMAPSCASRPYQHAELARKTTTDGSYLLNWIRKIQAEGREPSVMVLEELAEGTSRKFCGFVETCYIKSLRGIGHKLTNTHAGGWGGSGGPHTAASIAKMKAIWTPVARERARQQRIGVPLSESWSRAIREARKKAWSKATPEERQAHADRARIARAGVPGHTQTEGTREKIKATLMGRAMSKEWREKNAAAQRGKKQSDATRAKRSAALKLTWAKRIAAGYVVSVETRERIRATKLAVTSPERI